ncbi:hypothetical protein HOG21_06885 [bacterium]|jgi:hypothetical protein|nr:hypothetical protein [bacterium]
MKKIVKNFIIITLIIVSIYGFYYVNHKNYIKHIEIQRSYIEHPENLPKKDFAVKTSF